ncbi:MAG: sulfatase [Fuerstiella sp.]|nr:sulfatase [Fuerstiella sp.]MCP4510241.1 sulfatase [Fuerstiella sp.]
MRFTVLAATLTVTTAQFVNATAPNVILIFADDLGYGDVGCFDKHCPFRTPRIDRMAAEGAKLTSFYVPTPYCAPSRATILTGRYPFRHTVVRNPAPDVGESNFGLPRSEVTIAEILKSRGYATAAYGKWHLGHKAQWLPRTQGFDEYLGILYSNDMFPVQLVHNEQVVEYPVVQGSLTQRYTQKAVEFVRAHKDKPFFLYLPHAMPHKPLAVSDDFYTPQTRDNLYADVIAELDANVGSILDELSDLGIEQHTLVIFTSDNGPWFGGSAGGLRGMKARTWEGGLRVPMIARMPGTIAAGLTSDEPAATIDVLPTVCKLTNASVPADRVIDGHNILPLLQDPAAKTPHDAVFGMQGDNLATIRSGRWKLHVRSPGAPLFSSLSPQERMNYVDPRGPDGVTLLAPFEQANLTQHPGLISGDIPKAMMLFDLHTDRGEQIDVAGQHRDVVKRLKARFDTILAQVPSFPAPPSDYLFDAPPRGTTRTLMRLIGGELRYDRLPASQRYLMQRTP